jgi:hypothetical protein
LHGSGYSSPQYRRSTSATAAPVRDEFAEAYEDPGRLYGTEEYRKAHGWIYLGRREKRKQFERWCQKEGKDFREWLNRARDAAGPDNEDWVEQDWFPEGPRAYWQMRLAVDMILKARAYVDEVVAQTRLEVTEELLGSEFALGDGRKVTWREATVEDHEQRVAMLQKNVVANAEAAARHLKAVEMIRENNVRCLGQLPRDNASVPA